MPQPISSSKSTTTLDHDPSKPPSRSQPNNHPQAKDGAKTLLDAVTAYQRRTARAERTAATRHHQPTPSQRSPTRSISHSRSIEPDSSSLDQATPIPRILPISSSRAPHPSPRWSHVDSRSPRSDPDPQHHQSPIHPRSGSSAPSKKNHPSNPSRRSPATNDSNSKLFDPKLGSPLPSRRSSDKNPRTDQRSSKPTKPHNHHPLKSIPATADDHDSSHSNLSQSSHLPSKQQPPRLRPSSNQDRGWKPKKNPPRGNLNEPRQLFDPRKHDPVKFATSQRPNEIFASKPSTLGPLTNGDSQSLSSSYGTTDYTKDHPSHPTEDGDNRNDLVVNLKRAYKRIVSLETALKDEECAAKAKEEELRAREIREGSLSHPSLHLANNSPASPLRNQIHLKRYQEDYWVRLSKQHRELAEAHQQFLEMALNPRLPTLMHALPHKYNTPSRLWQIGFHQLLERLRHALPQSTSLTSNDQTGQLLLEHMTDFIYFAYGFYTALLEEQRLQPFKNVWIEQLGDLARYRMAVAGLMNKFSGGHNNSNLRVRKPPTKVEAVESKLDHEDDSSSERIRRRARRPRRSRDAIEVGTASVTENQSSQLDLSSPASQSRPDLENIDPVLPRPGGSIGLAALGDWDFEEQEIWRATAKDWYAKGLADNPATGRLHHHLALLSKGDELRTLYHYCKSLTAAHPYVPARESVLPFFEQEHQSRRSRPEVSINDLFVHLHGMLFTKIQLDDFDSELARFIEKLTEDRFLSDKQGRASRQFGRRHLDDIVARSTMSDASWVMMGTVNICAILQYGLEDGVIRLAQQYGHKSSQDAHSRHPNNKLSSKSASGSTKPTTLAPQAILLNHSSNINPATENRRPSVSISSEEDAPSAVDRDNPSSASIRLEQPDLKPANAENFSNDEHQAIMIRRTEVNDNDQENDPIVFMLAAKFTFEMLEEALHLNSSEHVCPYLTIVLTFLGSLCQNNRVMRKLERFIPWDALVSYFDRIPRSIQIRSPFPSSTQGHAQPASSSWSSHFKLVGFPLLEDWCLRGMDWTGKNLFSRGYWKQSKSSSANNLGSTDSAEQTMMSVNPLTNLNIDSELDALVALNGALEAGCQLDGSRPRQISNGDQGRIDLTDGGPTASGEGFGNGEDESAGKDQLHCSVDRWQRIGLAAVWISNSISGLEYHEQASSVQPRFMISQALRNKIARWEADTKREEEERQSLKPRRVTVGRYHQDQIAEFDLEIDHRADEDEEDEDDDDPCDSELVKSLKARRRELKMILNQCKNTSAQAAPNRLTRTTKSGVQKNPAPSQFSKTHQAGGLKNSSKLNAIAGYTTLVFDTNILIGMLSIVKTLLESERFMVIVPLVVITELDGLKKKVNDSEPHAKRLGEEALEAIKYLEQAIKTHPRVLKIQTSKGNYLRDLSIRNEQINFQDFGTTTSTISSTTGGKGFITTNTAKNLDDVVLRATSWQLEHFSNRLPSMTTRKLSGTTIEKDDDLAHYHQDSSSNEDEPEKVILLTLDRNLRLKARARGMLAADEKQIISLVDSISQPQQYLNGNNSGSKVNKKSNPTTTTAKI